jgi:nitrilase
VKSLIAVAQLCSGTSPEKNLVEAISLIEHSARSGASLTLLPENFILFDSLNLVKFGQSDEARMYLEQLANLARTLKHWIVLGSFPVPSNDGRVYSRSMVISEQGEIVGAYDKRHLFDVIVDDAKGSYLESKFIAPGDALSVVDTPIGRLGLSICYDLRFPNHYQALRDLGAEIITVPSAFTAVTGEAHWELLLRARAVETQSYVMGANQVGEHGAGRFTYGHSMIVDPWGRVVASLKSEVGVAIAEVDLSLLNKVRSEMPLLAQRR